ncbi:Plasmodium exported protein (Pm-fam-a like), unknown function [Plasmodium malariae]|uniref:Fam-l protein n=1 Tax=Plasmodium malariae TaxID=5858 RepID=A0A1A8WXE7_PLAMA|nr:Plasmodium exported protein (Pm-fam-a like), unknown function [Plasmodium malariae]
MTCTLNDNLEEKCNICRKLYNRNDRLLAKCKQGKDSSNANFKEEMPNNEVKEKIYISNNKKGTDGKHKQSCRSSLYIEEYGKNIEKNKCGLTKTKKYFDFEKKIFKELDNEDYVKNIKNIDYKVYKKLARKKRRIRIALLLLFILILILPILDLSLEKFKAGGLLGLLRLLYPTGNGGDDVLGVGGHLTSLLGEVSSGNINKVCVLSIFFYGVLLLIFVLTFILGMIYYYKKVIKYENVKFRKRLNKK